MKVKLNIQFFGGRGASSGVSGAGSTKGGLNLGSPIEQRDDYTKEEENALRAYTKSSHVNYELGVVGYDNMPEKYKEMVKQMDKAIAKSGWNTTQTDTPFLRGGGGIMIGVPLDKTFNSNQELADYINNNLIGKTTTNKGYTSMTRTMGATEPFLTGEKNPVILHYKEIKAGTRGAYVSGGNGKKSISVFGTSKDETLAQRNLKTSPISAWVGNDGNVHVSVLAGA